MAYLISPKIKFPVFYLILLSMNLHKIKLAFLLFFLSPISLILAQSKSISESGKPIFIVSNDLAQYAIRHIQFNVELISKKRGFGFNFYFNKGMSDLRDPSTYKKREATMNPVAGGDGFYKSYYVGADAKIYPIVESKKVKYFYSFGFEVGESSCRIEKENTMTYMPGYHMGNTYYYYSMSTNTTKSVNYYTDLFWGLHHKQGCLWSITRWLYLGAEINVGLNRFYEPGINSEGKRSKSNSIKYGAGLSLGLAI